MIALASPDIAPAGWALPADEVHLWHVGPEAATLDPLPLLSPDERARAAAMGLAVRRRQYTGVRAALRHVLAGYLHTDPRAIAFSYGAHGKPALHPSLAGSGIDFSVSHANSHGVIAVARTSALGVDMERVVDGRRALAVAERIFASREAAGLRTLASADLAHGFTVLWTRKEAYVKALGDGLTLPLACFEVSASANPPAVVRCAASDPRSPEAWRMAETRSVPDHVCTVAMAQRADAAPAAAIRLRELSLAADFPGASASIARAAC